MRLTKHPRVLRAVFGVAALWFSLTLCSWAQTFTTLATFNSRNGQAPLYGSLVQATNGNYYGTTNGGGKNSRGVVFEVTPAGELSDIYSFCAEANCKDGENPWSALVLGSDGNLYGTTNTGGTHGSGTVFRMTLGGKLNTLYNFCPTTPCSDGQYPVGLMQASNGNFYGTTSDAGNANPSGTIFEISAAGKFKALYGFCSLSNCADGSYPLSAPMQASNGNLYGTTHMGGASSAGTVYKITPTGVFRTLYSFCAQTGCADGSSPFAGLTQDASGNLYGTTEFGGANGYGTVFKITTAGQFIILHNFDSTNGANPVSGLVLASDGNLYGTTIAGGAGASDGIIYEITPTGVFRSLFSFCNASGCAAYYPSYTLEQATNGEFIGATTNDPIGYGTVFRFSTGLGPIVETVPKAAKIGARVIILGNGLTNSTSVAFHGTAAAFTVVSDTAIMATIPAGATTGLVSVVTPSGTLYSNPGFQVLH